MAIYDSRQFGQFERGMHRYYEGVLGRLATSYAEDVSNAEFGVRFDRLFNDGRNDADARKRSAWFEHDAQEAQFALAGDHSRSTNVVADLDRHVEAYVDYMNAASVYRMHAQDLRAAGKQSDADGFDRMAAQIEQNAQGHISNASGQAVREDPRLTIAHLNHEAFAAESAGNHQRAIDFARQANDASATYHQAQTQHQP